MQKTALVFGHTSGLGLAVSQELIQNGYRVIGLARSSAKCSSPRLIEIGVDLSEETGLADAITAIRAQHPSFDVLVYCAGTLTAHEIDALDYATMINLYKLNLFAPMLIESKLLDLIERNGADVVNVTSSSILDFYPKFSEYSSAKAAFAKFTDDLRRRLRETEARVIELCPSGFTSRMYSSMTGEKIERDESKQIAAADLARLVVHVLELPKVLEVGRLYVNRK